MKREIFLIAGEASADLHGAKLLTQLKAQFPELTCFGVGGKRLREAGMEVSLDASELNVVGISDWMHKVPSVLKSYFGLKRLVRERKPNCAILIDLPDFNLRMAKHLKSWGVPVIYYVSPQVWAWRKYRIEQIKARVDKMLVVFPFEKTFYDQNNVDVTFVGHPLLEERVARDTYRTQQEIESAPRIGLLPGSRTSELRYHLPLLLETREQILKVFPQAQFFVPVAPTLRLQEVEHLMEGPSTTFCRGDAENVLKGCDVALVASGTATLETALTGTPFALFYRVSRSSAFIFKYIARYRGFLGMPNLLHGREIIREFFQEKATSENLVTETVKLIRNESYRKEVAERLVECRNMLGTQGATARAAAEVARVLENVRKTDDIRYQENPVLA